MIDESVDSGIIVSESTFFFHSFIGPHLPETYCRQISLVRLSCSKCISTWTYISLKSTSYPSLRTTLTRRSTFVTVGVTKHLSDLVTLFSNMIYKILVENSLLVGTILVFSLCALCLLEIMLSLAFRINSLKWFPRTVLNCFARNPFQSFYNFVYTRKRI